MKEKTKDIGLWRLDRNAELIPGILMPICLPESFDRKGTDSTTPGSEDFPVYTSGWGRLFTEHCVTNELGPVRSLKCQFPFNDGSRDMPNYKYSCSQKRTPDARVIWIGESLKPN